MLLDSLLSTVYLITQMLKSIKIHENSPLSKILLFNNIEFRQINFLFGINGAGKSSLIDACTGKNMEYRNSITAITDKVTNIYQWKNSDHNMKYKGSLDTTSNYLGRQFNSIINSRLLSEGESILYAFQDIIELLSEIETTSDSIIFIDEIDSGLSINNIEYITEIIKNIEKTIPNVQLVLSFNNYHFIHIFHEAIDMMTGKLINIKDYEDYCNQINRQDKILKSCGRNVKDSGQFEKYK